MSANDASRITIGASRVMLQIVASLTDNSTGIIYNFCTKFMNTYPLVYIPNPQISVDAHRFLV
jgi:hypothetical protein